jgi:hypothetical protein
MAIAWCVPVLLLVLLVIILLLPLLVVDVTSHDTSTWSSIAGMGSAILLLLQLLLHLQGRPFTHRVFIDCCDCVIIVCGNPRDQADALCLCLWQQRHMISTRREEHNYGCSEFLVTSCHNAAATML